VSVLAVGLMSGTSLDGVDAALVEIDGPESLRLRAFHTRPYSEEQSSAVRAAIQAGAPRDLALLHVGLGHRLADAVGELLERSGTAAAQLGFIASHGQTVWHEPGRATLQLGDPAILAERFGVRVVSDFRSRDVAAGGQGAPLVPLADAMLFGHAERGRALLNVGGMANVTWVPRRGSLEGVVAFDTGPGVAVMDAVTRLVDPGAGYDRGGERAARGNAHAALLAELLAHPFFSEEPPRSTGRETFGDPYAAELVRRLREAEAGADDCVATALELTTCSVALGLERWLPEGGERDVLISGGGARNPALMQRLGALLEGWDVKPFEAEFFDGDAKEAAVFAYLGWRTLEGLAGNVPAATGAEGPRVLGSVTPSGRL
jgi:anhydro-N-acetylmuramic acid kinase